MKRTELARGPIRLSRRTPLARTARLSGQPRQARQKAQGATKTGDWSDDTREAVSSRSQGWCEVCGQRPATDMHHRRPRRTRDHREVNAVHCCRQCHRGAHEHPADSRGFGWIVHTTRDPATVPMLVNGNRWVLLEPGGKYRTDQRGWPTP